MSAINPYEAPKANVDDVGDDSEFGNIRRSHIKHEASLKSVGVLYYLGAIMMGFTSAALLFGLFDTTAARAEWGSSGFVVLFMLAFCIASGVAGRGLRTLKPWARIPTAILSGIGLLGFPLGTLVNGYILWLVFSQKGRTILSDEYAAIVAATPHVRYRTSIVVWILVALLILLVVALAVGMSRSA